MQTETVETPNPNGKTKNRKVKPSSQTQVPGTEKGSEELRKLHEAFACAKYEAKAANDKVKELKPDVIRLMEEEDVESLSCDVDYGDEVRRAVTTLATKSKLRTQLEDKDQDGD